MSDIAPLDLNAASNSFDSFSKLLRGLAIGGVQTHDLYRPLNDAVARANLVDFLRVGCGPRINALERLSSYELPAYAGRESKRCLSGKMPNVFGSEIDLSRYLFPQLPSHQEKRGKCVISVFQPKRTYTHKEVAACLLDMPLTTGFSDIEAGLKSRRLLMTLEQVQGLAEAKDTGADIAFAVEPAGTNCFFITLKSGKIGILNMSWNPRADNPYRWTVSLQRVEPFSERLAAEAAPTWRYFVPM